jgi:hypothetical protein
MIKLFFALFLGIAALSSAVSVASVLSSSPVQKADAQQKSKESCAKAVRTLIKQIQKHKDEKTLVYDYEKRGDCGNCFSARIRFTNCEFIAMLVSNDGEEQFIISRSDAETPDTAVFVIDGGMDGEIDGAYQVVFRPNTEQRYSLGDTVSVDDQQKFYEGSLKILNARLYTEMDARANDPVAILCYLVGAVGLVVLAMLWEVFGWKVYKIIPFGGACLLIVTLSCIVVGYIRGPLTWYTIVLSALVPIGLGTWLADDLRKMSRIK